MERKTNPRWFHAGRFLTLHKRRKKKPPTRAIISEQALLDDLYYGPIRVSFILLITNLFFKILGYINILFVDDSETFGTHQRMAFQCFRIR